MVKTRPVETGIENSSYQEEIQSLNNTPGPKLVRIMGTILLRHHISIVVRTVTQTPEFKFGTRGSFKWFVFCFYLPRNKKNRYCSMPLQIAAN